MLKANVPIEQIIKFTKLSKEKIKSWDKVIKDLTKNSKAFFVVQMVGLEPTHSFL